MKTCPSCSSAVEDNAAFCGQCGYAFAASENTEPKVDQKKADDYSYGQTDANKQNDFTPPNPPFQSDLVDAPSGKLSIGYLIWNIFLILNICTSIPSGILGIIGLVKTINAKKAATKTDEKAMLKTVLTIDIIGTVLLVLGSIITIIVAVIFGAAIWESVIGGSSAFDFYY